MAFKTVLLFLVVATFNSAVIKADYADIQAALLKRSSTSATSGFSIKKLISSKFSSKPKEHKCEKPSKEEMAKATPEQAFDKLWDHIS